MSDREKLDAMELLQERYGVTLEEARAALESCGWDVPRAAAAIAAERGSTLARPRGSADRKEWLTRLQNKADRLLQRLLEHWLIIRDARGDLLCRMPVLVAVLLLLCAPVLLVAAAALWVLDCTFAVEKSCREDGAEG